MTAADVRRILARADSGISVTEPGRQWMETATGRARSLPDVTYTPAAVLVPDRAPDDETAPDGANARRVRAYLSPMLPTGATWPAPKAGHIISDGSATYTINAVTVYKQHGAALLYEARAAA